MKTELLANILLVELYKLRTFMNVEKENLFCYHFHLNTKYRFTYIATYIHTHTLQHPPSTQTQSSSNSSASIFILGSTVPFHCFLSSVKLKNCFFTVVYSKLNHQNGTIPQNVFIYCQFSKCKSWCVLFLI